MLIRILFILQRVLQWERTWWFLTSLLKVNKKYHQSFFLYFLKWEQKDNGFAKFVLAYCYDKGIYVKEDSKKAFKYASESAQLGNMYGLNLLGVFYENGYGVVCNPSRACELYWQSANLGCSLGETSLSKLYIELDHPKSNEIINSYLKHAAKKRNPYALNLLGMLYINGTHILQNYVKGFKLCYAAAKKKNYYGIQSVIYICENNFVEMSIKKKRRILNYMKKQLGS